MAKEIQAPHNFTPRDYQLPFFKAMDSGYKRAILTWSRRHGKDKASWCYLIKAMMERVGNYAYIFPTASLARKAAWQNIDSDGFKFIDHIPKELIKRKQDMQMHIELINGSTVTFFGSDRQMSVGTAFKGIVFSEFALQDQATFNLFRPVVMQNNGFLIVNSTPRGRNHYYDLWETTKDNGDWFRSLVTARDTDVFSKESIQAELASGMSEELMQQELYCSFNRGVEGSFLGRDIDKARNEGRICNVYPEAVMTYAAFDLGMDDSTAIVVWQQVGQEIHVIDYHENHGQAIEYYVNWLKSTGYHFDTVALPHDSQVRELSSGISRVETFRRLGVNCVVLPNAGLMDGIETARQTIGRCWFDETRCKKLLDCLEMYCREYNEKNGVYNERPKHDKYSHGADGFRYMAQYIATYRDSGKSEMSTYNQTLRPRL